MAGKTMTSTLGKKAGAKLLKAHEAHKDDEVVIGGARGNLPEMDFAVAEVVECKIGYYEKGENVGEPFYFAAAVIKSPARVPVDKDKWVDVKGMRTQVGPIPLCDKKWPDGNITPFDENYATMLNELRKLGLDTRDINPDEIENVICPALAKQGILTKLHTYKSKNGKIREEWDGVWDGDPNTLETDDGVQDNSGSASQDSSGGEENGGIPFGDEIDDLVANASSDDETIAGPAQESLTEQALALGYTQDQINDETLTWQDVGEWVRSGTGPDGDSGGEESSGDDEAIDFDALGAAADEEYGNGEEGEATAKVKELAEAAGIDPNGYATYSEVTALLASNEGQEGSGDSSEEEAKVPEKGQIWFYKPWILDTKTKKMVKAKKGTEHEIASVQEAAQTVQLKSLETNRLILDQKTKKPLSVPWSELSEEE